MSFFAELKRRNVFKVGVAYAIVAWLLIQIVATVFPILALPDWTTRFITIVVIIGFPIAILLAWIYELTPEGIKVTASEGPAQYHTQTTGQRLNYFIIGVLVLLVAFLVVDNYVLNSGTRDSGPGARQEKITTAGGNDGPAANDKGQATNGIPNNSIAVLPFKNMSSDPEQEYFADGIAEQLLDQLAKIHGLQVAGRTSSFTFKGRNEDLRIIGEKLGVAHILEGSVRKAGDRVRITTQLIKATDGYHLWSETYDRKMDDIFAIQDDIARSVANALQITLGIGELGQTPGMTRNVEAYEAFLAGRSLMRNATRENVSRAIEQLEQAVALDPNFAIGWSALAGSYGAAGGTFIPEKAKEYFAKSDAAGARVIELVPEADYALRIKAQKSGDRVEVERLYKQALSQDPENSDTNMGYGQFLLDVGRSKEAVEYFRRAVRVEPLASITHLFLGNTYEVSGNSAAAAESFKQGRELSNDPTIPNTALLVLALEKNDKTRIEEYRTQVPSPGGSPNPGAPTLGQVTRALLDDPTNAETELNQFLTDPTFANPFNRTAIAVWASYFGEYKLALRIWKEVNDPGWSIWRPIYQGMRRLPGFKDLVTKAGLVDYWRRTGNWSEFCHPKDDDDFECE